MKFTDSVEYPTLKRSPSMGTKGLLLPIVALRHRLRLIQWLAPFAMVLLVILYEIGPASWLHDLLGDKNHFWAEVLFFGTIGPVLVFMLLDLLGKWLEERETSDLQAQVLARAREQARISHEVTDDAIQAVFAASVFLSSLETRLPDLPAEVSDQLRATNRALDPIIRQLYAHQSKKPPSEG